MAWGLEPTPCGSRREETGPCCGPTPGPSTNPAAPRAPQTPGAALSQLDRVSILAEALPYMQKFAGKTIVVKYGGAAMKDPTLKVGAQRSGVRPQGARAAAPRWHAAPDPSQ